MPSRKPTRARPRGCRRLITIKLHTWIESGGDGSGFVRFYETPELAAKAAERGNERFTDDLDTHEITIDAATGEIVKGVITTLDKD